MRAAQSFPGFPPARQRTRKYPLGSLVWARVSHRPPSRRTWTGFPKTKTKTYHMNWNKNKTQTTTGMQSIQVLPIATGGASMHPNFNPPIFHPKSNLKLHRASSFRIIKHS